MFESKSCPRCDKKVKGDWAFCPFCGHNLKTPEFNIFGDVEKEFARIDKLFGSAEFPRFKLSPGGISITISSGRQPNVSVRTSGGYKKIEPEIKKRLGVRPPMQKEPTKRVSKIIEEPETKIEKSGLGQTITIKLPGVKSPGDVEIKRLEQSIEIKAFAKDKTYFKLIPIPPNMQISDKRLEEDSLKIRLA